MSKVFGIRPEVYITLKADDDLRFPNNIKMVCSGGCGDEVWVNEKWKRIISKIPVLCLDCGNIYLETNKDPTGVIVTRRVKEIMYKFTDENGVCLIPNNWREILRDKDLKTWF